MIQPTFPSTDWRVNNVIFCPTPRDTSGLRGADDPLSWKRIRVWHASKRNQLIACVAQGFDTRDIEALWDVGLLLAEETFPAALQSPCWTTLLVESLEHARALQRLLPAWPIRSVNANQPRQPVRQLGQGCIMTLVAADRMSPFRPKVLINAMGGSWTPQDVIHLTPHACQPVTLIDFDDDHDSREQEATRQRRLAYRCHGWSVK